VANVSDNKIVKFREGKSMLIPYIEIKLREDGGINIPKMWIGPTPHSSLSASAISKFLENEKCFAYKDQVCTPIPYVGSITKIV
jgi:hypothetical protein